MKITISPVQQIRPPMKVVMELTEQEFLALQRVIGTCEDGIGIQGRFGVNLMDMYSAMDAKKVEYIIRHTL